MEEREGNLRILAHGMIIGLLAFSLAFGVVAVLDVLDHSSLTAFAVNDNSLTYSQNVHIFAGHSIEVPIGLDNLPSKFDLYSFGISGKTEEGSSIRVYLKKDGKKFLVYSTAQPGFITGYTVGDNSDNLSEPSSSEQQDSQNPTPDPSANDQNSTESTPALEENPADTNITDSGSVISNLTDNQNSVPQENPAPEVSWNEFSQQCTETCDLRNKGFGENGYTLSIEVDSGAIRIDELNYRVLDLGSNVLRVSNVESGVYDTLSAGSGKAQVIIEFNQNQKGTMSVSSVESTPDIKVLHQFPEDNAIAAEIDSAGYSQLMASGNVARIYSDEILNVQMNDVAPQINASSVWLRQINGNNLTGKGQTVCVIDTGVLNHDALLGRIVNQKCYCYISGSGNCCPNGQATDTNAYDDNGHGTHVAGIIASNDATYKGVAPEVNIVAVKVCNAAGGCSSSDLASAINYCVSNAATYNISAISISIGGSASHGTQCDSTLSVMTSAINSAASSGILVSIAAGNYNHNNGVSWPSCVQTATAVSAVDKSDVIQDYSNRAPGITALLAVGGSGSRPVTSLSSTSGFAGMYGTSMAAPQVAGAVAIIQQYSLAYNNQKMSVDEIENLLERTGDVTVDSGTGNSYPRMNIGNALNAVAFGLTKTN